MSVGGYRLTPDHQNNRLQLCDGKAFLSSPKSIKQKNKNKNKQKMFNKKKNQEKGGGRKSAAHEKDPDVFLYSLRLLRKNYTASRLSGELRRLTAGFRDGQAQPSV